MLGMPEACVLLLKRRREFSAAFNQHDTTWLGSANNHNYMESECRYPLTFEMLFQIRSCSRE